MQCPTCSVTLQIADKQGVEIDYCPQCRGVWLDRGELEKIAERLHAYEQGPQPVAGAAVSEERTRRARQPLPEDAQYSQYDSDDFRSGSQQYRRKKKKRFDLFDDLLDF